MSFLCSVRIRDLLETIELELVLISSTVQSQVKAISENLESVLDFAMSKCKVVLTLLSQS